MGRAEPIQAQFNYWATTRSPDVTEALSIANLECPDIQSYGSVVHDIRPQHEHFTLDSHGFQVLKHSSSLLPPQRSDVDFSNLNLITAEYWREIRSVVKTELAARSVFVIHSAVRNSMPEPHVDPGKQIRSASILPPAKPFHLVHIDYSPAGSRTLLRAIQPSFFSDNDCLDSTTPAERSEFFDLRSAIISAEDDAIAASPSSDHLTWTGSNYTGPRWAILSIWRPLAPVQSDPLAILDPNSLFTSFPPPTVTPQTSPLDLDPPPPYQPIRLPHANRPGFAPYYEITNMMPLHPNVSKLEHIWYWLSDQQTDEVYALKLFDSEAWKEKTPTELSEDATRETVMPCAAHSAFELPTQHVRNGAGVQNGEAGISTTAAAPPTTPSVPRRSIETRVLVVW